MVFQRWTICSNLSYFYSTSTWKHVLDFSLAMLTLKSIYIYVYFQGSSIGLYFINRPVWVITDHACSAYSYISVPLYDTLGIHLLVTSSVWRLITPYLSFLLNISSFLSLQDRMLSSILWTMLQYKPSFVFPKHSMGLVHPSSVWVITVYLNWS